MSAEASLQDYLHQHIPLSATMRVGVQSVTPDSITLSAPLEPNINHKNTAFGGSVSALGILAAWSLVHVRLVTAGRPGEVVIQSNQMDYDRPINGTFHATSSLSISSDWPLFLRTLERRGRARIEVESVLTCRDIMAGHFRGRFVAFLRKDP